MKYRKKPVIIEAIQWTGENEEEIREFCPDIVGTVEGQLNRCILIPTLEGDQLASPGDFIIKGIEEFYPCKPDVFRETYEPVEEKP